MDNCIYCGAISNKDSFFCCKSCEILYEWIKKSNPPKMNTELSSFWRPYNQVDIENTYKIESIKLPETKHFKLYIEGLQCSSCVHLLEDAGQFQSKIQKCKLNYSQQTLDVIVDQSYGLGDLCQLIESLGYKVKPISGPNEYEQIKKIERKSDLKKLTVAAAAAGNQMLFAIPLYAGLSGNLAFYFKWISFFIFLPIVFYSATGIYKSAWSGLKMRYLNVDLMITLALWAGFVFSTYSLITNGDELYFDSTASFIFLILTTRYFLRKHQDRLSMKNLFGELFEGAIYEVKKKSGWQKQLATQIQAQDLLKIKFGQLVPADALLMSENIELDLSFMTGEAYPQVKHKHDKIYAGARVLSESALVSALSSGPESELSISFQKMKQTMNPKDLQSNDADHAAHWLTSVVFFVAGLYFFMAYPDLGIEAFKRSLALITIACPCALAFGTPLAYTLGLRAALKKGFFIKSEDVIKRIEKIKTIIFDKTGTLTSPILKIDHIYPPDLTEDQKEIILGLEKTSVHPVALSLRRAWPQTKTSHFESIQEKVGSGVVGQFENINYELKKNIASDGNNIQVDFLMNGKTQACIFFKEEILTEAKATIKELYHADFKVLMLSGDKRVRALEAAKELGIRPSLVFSEQSAEDKEQVVQNYNPCLYVGDGLNDLRALGSASLSFAVRGAFSTVNQVCDVYAPKNNLRSLEDFLALSYKIQKTVKANLFFALLYNAIGGAMALLGFINPLVAAVLMPISSLLITSHTLWRLK